MQTSGTALCQGAVHVLNSTHALRVLWPGIAMLHGRGKTWYNCRGGRQLWNKHRAV